MIEQPNYPATSSNYTRTNGFLVPFLAGFSIICAALLNFTIFHEYPTMSREIAITMLGIAVICGLTTTIYIGVRSGLRILLELLLIGISADLMTDGWTWVIAAIAIALVIRLKVREQFLSMAIVFACLLAATTFFKAERPAS